MSGNPDNELVKWPRRRWMLLLGGTALALATVIGISVAVSVSNENARVQAAQQAAKEEADRIEAEAKAAHEDAVSDAQDELEAGEKRFVESEAWADPEARVDLRAALDELSAVLGDDATTEELDAARAQVTKHISIVGTQAQAEQRAAAAAQAAQDAQYADLAAQYAGNGHILMKKGRAYCDYLHEYYTPQNIYPTLWGDKTEALEIDVAAIQIYCPEYAPVMNQVVAGFYDGNHVVGRDFPAGSYRTWGGVSNCYWERNDGSGNIIDNNFISAAHNGVTVALRQGEGFVTDGCGLWVPAG